MGSTATRMFLSDLSDVVIKRFRSRNIASSYFYLGKDADEADKEFSVIDKAGYKAILFLSPKGSDLSGKVYFRNYNSKNVSYTAYNSYHQLYDFQLCMAGKANQLFWNAIVNIDCDPTKKYAAKRTATKLLNRFEAMKYIE